MRLFKLLTTTIFVMCSAQPVWADTISISDKTVLTDKNLDRIYFNPEGTFFQQLENQYGALEPGQLLNGQWEFTSYNQELCLNYIEPKLDRACFDLVINEAGYSVFDKSGSLHFQWPIIRQGNWLFTKDGMNFILDKNDADDADIGKYIQGRVVDLPGRFSVFFQDNETAIYYEENEENIIEHSYTIENGMVTGTDPYNQTLYNLNVTFGREFLDADKANKIHIYLYNGLFLSEGTPDLKITNLADYPKKEVFIDSDIINVLEKMNVF